MNRPPSSKPALVPLRQPSKTPVKDPHQLRLDAILLDLGNGGAWVDSTFELLPENLQSALTTPGILKALIQELELLAADLCQAEADLGEAQRQGMSPTAIDGLKAVVAWHRTSILAHQGWIHRLRNGLCLLR